MPAQHPDARFGRRQIGLRANECGGGGGCQPDGLDGQYQEEEEQEEEQNEGSPTPYILPMGAPAAGVPSMDPRSAGPKIASLSYTA